MSEYIKIETEAGDQESVMYVYTNLNLSDGAAERYESVEAMEEGSPLAQALSVIQGIVALDIEGKELNITRDPDSPWHALVGDISAVLKEFFL